MNNFILILCFIILFGGVLIAMHYRLNKLEKRIADVCFTIKKNQSLYKKMEKSNDTVVALLKQRLQKEQDLK